MFGQIDWTAFQKGMQAEGDRQRRLRSENAKAFEEFRKSNPYATLADLQGKIDSLSDGSNYLRGGLASDTLLNTIAGENKRALEQRNFEDMIGNETKRAQLFGTFEASLDNALLMADEEDLANAAENFIQANPGLAGDPGLSSRVRSAFNPTRRNSLISEQVEKYLPRAQTIIQNSNGDVDADAINKAFGGNIPKSILTPLVTTAQNKYKQDQQTRSLGLAKDFIAAAVRAMKDGQADVIPLLRDEYRRAGVNVDDAVINNLAAQAQKEYKRQQDEYTRTNRESLARTVIEMMEKGQGEGFDVIRDIYADSGFTLDDATWSGLRARADEMRTRDNADRDQQILDRGLRNMDAYLKQVDAGRPEAVKAIDAMLRAMKVTSISDDVRDELYARAEENLEQRRREREDANRTRTNAFKDRVKDNLQTVGDQLEKDPALVSALRTGDMEAANRIIQREINVLPVDIRTAIPDGWRDGLVDGIMSQFEVSQGQVLEKRRLRIEGERREWVKKTLGDNVSRATAYFGSKDKTGQMNSQGSDGKPQQNAGGAAQVLARNFYLDSTALDALRNVWAALPGGTDQSILVQAGQAALAQAGAVTMSDYNQAYNDMAGSSAYASGRPLTMENYLSQNAQVLNAERKGTTDFISNTIKNHADNPAQALRILQHNRPRLALIAEQQLARMDRSAETSLGDETWLQYGSAWDGAKHSELRNDIEAGYREMLAELDRAIEETKNAVAEKAERERTRVPTPTAPNRTGESPQNTPFINSVERGKIRARVDHLIGPRGAGSIAREYGVDAGLIGYFASSQADRETARLVLGAIRAKGLAEVLEAKPELIDLLEDNPVVFAQRMQDPEFRKEISEGTGVLLGAPGK